MDTPSRGGRVNLAEVRQSGVLRGVNLLSPLVRPHTSSSVRAGCLGADVASPWEIPTRRNISPQARSVEAVGLAPEEYQLINSNL